MEKEEDSETKETKTIGALEKKGFEEGIERREAMVGEAIEKVGDTVEEVIEKPEAMAEEAIEEIEVLIVEVIEKPEAMVEEVIEETEAMVGEVTEKIEDMAGEATEMETGEMKGRATEEVVAEEEETEEMILR